MFLFAELCVPANSAQHRSRCLPASIRKIPFWPSHPDDGLQSLACILLDRGAWCRIRNLWGRPKWRLVLGSFWGMMHLIRDAGLSWTECNGGKPKMHYILLRTLSMQRARELLASFCILLLELWGLTYSSFQPFSPLSEAFYCRKSFFPSRRRFCFSHHLYLSRSVAASAKLLRSLSSIHHI